MFHSRHTSRPAPARPVARGSSLVRALPMQVSGASGRIAPVRQWSLSVVGSTGEMRLDQQLVEVPSPAAMISTRNITSYPTSFSSTSATAWRQCLLKLTDSERKLFKENEITSFEELLASAMSASKTQEDNSRILMIAKKLRPLVEAVNLYGGVAQTMVQANPAPAALVLGGVNCLMSIPSRFADYQERLSDILSEMGRQLHNLKKYQAGMYENEPDVDDALIQVYIDMVEFCREATRLLFDRFGKPRSSLRTLLRSTLQPFDYKFGAMAKKFDNDVRYFEKSVQIAFEKDRQRFQREVRRAMGQATDNQNVMGTLQTSFFDDTQSKTLQKRHVEDEINERVQEKRARILAWLPTVDFEIDQRNNLLKRLEGTGRWLLEDSKFKDWKRKAKADSLPPNILCVQGQSGCGKSCLAALVIDKYTKKSRASAGKVAVAYAYCSKMDTAKFNPVRILSSVMQQLSDQIPGYGIDALQRIFDKSQRKFPPTEDQLEDAISLIANKFKKVFLVIDGLDECNGLGEEAFGQFCTSLRNIAHARPAVVRLIVFSRPGYTQINNAFQSDPRILVDSVANEEDIKQYIFSVTRGEELLIRNNSELLEVVEQTLLQKADGMFLWVRLLVQTLKTARTKKQLMSMINSLPQDLHEIYDRSLDQILNKANDKDLSLRILLWIANAKRPLSSDELKTALQIDDESNMLNDANLLVSEEGITAECGDLIVLRDDHYHLLHSSLQDYLTKLDSKTSVKLQEYRELQVKANEILGKACLNYLLFNDFKKGPFETLEGALALLKENPFLDYAGTNWGYHVTAAGEEGFGTLICDFVECGPARELFIQFYHHFRDTKDGVYPYQGATTPLHALSIFNLIKTASKFVGILQSRNDRDGFGYLPLDYALAEGSREMCTWLLKNDSSTEGYPAPQGGNFLPIHVATVNDWGDVIKIMIGLGFDANRPSAERRRTALHEAASLGSQSALLALLEAKVNVNAEDIDKQTPIIEAAEGNRLDAILPLLEAGANVHHQGWGGLTALHQAAVTGNFEIAKLLLRWNAEADTCTGEGWGQRTPLHIAAENNHLAIAQLLVDHGASVDRPCSQNYTPLLLAASSGSFEVTKLLLRLKANVSISTEAGESALHVAAANGHLEIVKLLQAHQPSLLRSLDNRRNTPLHSALQARETKVGLELLRMGSAVDASDDIGQTALHLAVMHDLEEIVKVLISDYGADRTKKGLLGSTPLHYAAQWGYSHLIEPLIGNNGGDPEALNDDQQAVVHFAARQKQIDFLRTLVSLVPNINLGVLDKWEQSPLHLAARAGSSDLVRYLVIERKMSSTEEDDKNLPLHLAAWNGHTDCVELLLTTNTVNAKGFCGRTALFAASSRGHIATVKLLLNWNADPNVLDDFNQGPLIVALKNKHVEIAKVLLASKADPNVPDKWDSISLHFAALIGDKELVTKLLLEAHCDGLCQNAFGDTPFLQAVYSDDVELIDIFLDNGVNGCAITNRKGHHAFEIAARKGNLKMFEKLIDAGNSLGVDHFSADLFGDTALCAAAISGETALLDPLLKLGFNIDGLGSSHWTPLMHASSNGNTSFLNALLERGPNLNTVAEAGITAIAMAAAEKRPIIFHRLLKAGADPLIRDVFGWNALDYAYQYPPLWECLDDSLRMSYQPLDDTRRAKILRSIIVEKAEAVLEMELILTPELQMQRLMAMLIIAHACVYLQTEASIADAMVFNKEMCNLPESDVFRPELKCAVCMEEPISGPVYTCTYQGCWNSDLCETCHLDWIKGSNTPKSIPPGVRTLEELEHELQSIRAAVWKLITLGAEFTFDALNILKPVQRWFDEKLKAYRDWEQQYNDQNRFIARDIPGRDFMEIMAQYREIQTEDDDKPTEGNEDPTTMREATSPPQQENSTPRAIESVSVAGDPKPKEDVLQDLDKQLVQLFKKCRPDRELPDFTCSGHERLKIPVVKWSEEDIPSGPFNENGRVTNEWLRTFVERYKSPEQVITDGALTSEPLIIEEAAVEEVPRSEKMQDTEHNQSPPILTPAQADAVFFYNTPEEKPKAVPLNFASAPDLQPPESPKDTHPINSNEDSMANFGGSVASNSLSRRGTFEMVEEMQRNQVSRKPTIDWLQVATSVPLPPSRQGTLQLTDTAETSGSKELVVREDYGEDKSSSEVVSKDAPPVEQAEPELEPILKSKLDVVTSIHKEMREGLADSAVGVLQSLAEIDDNVTKGLLGLNEAIDNAASALGQKNQLGDNNSATTYGALDASLVGLRIKVWVWDAAFDVVQLVLLGQRLGDLVPNYDLDRLLRTENRMIVIQEQAEQDQVLVPEQQPSNHQPPANAVTPEAAKSHEQ